MSFAGALFAIILSWILMSPFIIPASAKMLSQVGRSRWWAALLLIPYAGFVAVLFLQGKMRAS